MSFLTVREVKTARSVAEAYGAICQLKIRQRDLHERVEGAVEIALDSAELSAYHTKHQTRKLCLLRAKSRFKPIEHYLDVVAPFLNQGVEVNSLKRHTVTLLNAP